MSKVTKKTVLITGCSTAGIGWAVARRFQNRGYHVFATSRDPSTVSELGDLPDVDVLPLDVTVPGTINACRDTITQRTGGTLDVLVNNAGTEFLSPLLDVEIGAVQKLFDVNVFGVLRVTQAFAPLLVAAKGCVVNHSSIDAAISPVWAGIYASSKAAVTRLSETLRLELAPLGVRVITAMCGSADTPFFTRPEAFLNLPQGSYYKGIEDTAHAERKAHQKEAWDVSALAEKLVQDTIDGKKGIIWHGSYAPTVRYSTLLLPTSVLDGIVNNPRGIKKVKLPKRNAAL